MRILPDLLLYTWIGRNAITQPQFNWEQLDSSSCKLNANFFPAHLSFLPPGLSSAAKHRFNSTAENCFCSVDACASRENKRTDRKSCVLLLFLYSWIGGNAETSQQSLCGDTLFFRLFKAECVFACGGCFSMFVLPFSA